MAENAKPPGTYAELFDAQEKLLREYFASDRVRPTTYQSVMIEIEKLLLQLYENVTKGQRK